MPSSVRFSPASPSAPRMLCVDDDPLMGRALEATLRNLGYGSRVVTSAYEALAVLRSEPIDIVLTDQQMPGMTGLDLLREMRSEGFATPVIVVTGFGSLDQAVAAVGAGAAYYLTKPAEPAALQQLIDDIRRTPVPSRADGQDAKPPRDPLAPAPVDAAAAGRAAAAPPGAEVLVLSSLNVEEAERELIRRAMTRTNNDRTAAAKLLGMHPGTLWRKLQDMGLEPGPKR